jgi:RNA polymerase sigma-70 factor (ECF subfamily)
MGSAAEAEDVLQNLYLRLCSMGDYQDVAEIADPAAYLYRLCLNMAADNRRGQTRRLKREDAYHYVHARVEGGYTLVDAPSPETAVEARLRLEKIIAAVETLPAQQRRVFRLHRIQGLSYREISENLGISGSAVEKHMIAALKRLATWEL